MRAPLSSVSTPGFPGMAAWPWELPPEPWPGTTMTTRHWPLLPRWCHGTPRAILSSVQTVGEGLFALVWYRLSVASKQKLPRVPPDRPSLVLSHNRTRVMSSRQSQARRQIWVTDTVFVVSLTTEEALVPGRPVGPGSVPRRGVLPQKAPHPSIKSVLVIRPTSLQTRKTQSRRRLWDDLLASYVTVPFDSGESSNMKKTWDIYTGRVRACWSSGKFHIYANQYKQNVHGPCC